MSRCHHVRCMAPWQQVGDVQGLVDNDSANRKQPAKHSRGSCQQSAAGKAQYETNEERDWQNSLRVCSSTLSTVPPPLHWAIACLACPTPTRVRHSFLVVTWPNPRPLCRPQPRHVLPVTYCRKHLPAPSPTQQIHVPVPCPVSLPRAPLHNNNYSNPKSNAHPVLPKVKKLQ